jgi:hypothetical protein
MAHPVLYLPAQRKPRRLAMKTPSRRKSLALTKETLKSMKVKSALRAGEPNTTGGNCSGGSLGNTFHCNSNMICTYSEASCNTCFGGC